MQLLLADSPFALRAFHVSAAATTRIYTTLRLHLSIPLPRLCLSQRWNFPFIIDCYLTASFFFFFNFVYTQEHRHMNIDEQLEFLSDLFVYFCKQNIPSTVYMKMHSLPVRSQSQQLQKHATKLYMCSIIESLAANHSAIAHKRRIATESEHLRAITSPLNLSPSEIANTLSLSTICGSKLSSVYGMQTCVPLYLSI